MRTTFKALPIGTLFRFASEEDHRFSGLAKGPWVKRGPRTYIHAEEPPSRYGILQVGTIRVEVLTF